MQYSKILFLAHYFSLIYQNMMVTKIWLPCPMDFYKNRTKRTIHIPGPGACDEHLIALHVEKHAIPVGKPWATE